MLSSVNAAIDFKAKKTNMILSNKSWTKAKRVMMLALLCGPFFNAHSATPVQQASVGGSVPIGQSVMTSLAGEYGRLEKRAATGDRMAAIKLASDIRRCEQVRSMEESIKFWREYRRSQGDDLAALKDAWPPSYSKEQRSALVRDQNGLCDGYDGDMRDGRAYAVLLQAANSGDWDSAECYVATEYPFTQGKYKETDWTVYRSNALRLLDDAIHQGQWGVVRAAMTAMTVMWIDNLPPSAALGGDAVMSYRLHRLIALGMAPGAEEVQFLEQGTDIEARKITPQQRLESDRWASDTYRRYFSKSGASTPFTSACTHELMQFTVMHR